jgi:hypothetical protein
MEQDDRLWVWNNATPSIKGLTVAKMGRPTTTGRGGKGLIPEGYKRIWGRLPDEKDAQLKEWADSLGMSYSAFISLCVWVGAKQIMRTVEPEKIFTPDQWADLIEVAQERGILKNDEP